MREDQRQLIIERNKADEAKRLLNVQMVRWRHPHECPRPGLILTSLCCLFLFTFLAVAINSRAVR